jgi:hypothetical protein
LRAPLLPGTLTPTTRLTAAPISVLESARPRDLRQIRTRVSLCGSLR